MFNIIKQLTGCKLISNCFDIVANGSGIYGSHIDFGMSSLKTLFEGNWYNNRYLPWFSMFQIFCDDKLIHLAMKRKEINEYKNISIPCKKYQAFFAHGKMASIFKHGILSKSEYAMIVWRYALLGGLV